MEPIEEYKRSLEAWERSVKCISEQEKVRGKSPSVRPSFYAILADVMGRVEYECFDADERQMAREMCLVIAEVGSLPDTGMIRVDGVEQAVGTIKEVFATLRHEHLVSVAEKFRALPYRVKNIKAYLRTALYNSAFELAAEEANEIAVLFAGGKNGS